MADSGTIGGVGPILVVVGPAAVGLALGAFLGGKNHRLMGAAIGGVAGAAATFGFIQYNNARNTALMNAPAVVVTSLRSNGFPYILSTTTGGDIVTQATAAGFHVDGSQPHGVGPIQAIWQGANNAPVPAGISAMQSAASATQ